MKDKKFRCTLCGFMFTEQRSLNRHHIRTHGDPKFTCDYCGSTFKHESNLKQHFDVHEKKKKKKPQKKKIFICEICKMKFTRKTSWERHKNNKNIHQ